MILKLGLDVDQPCLNPVALFSQHVGGSVVYGSKIIGNVLLRVDVEAKMKPYFNAFCSLKERKAHTHQSPMLTSTALLPCRSFTGGILTPNHFRQHTSLTHYLPGLNGPDRLAHPNQQSVFFF